MDRFTERQTELISYLNDNCVEPSIDLCAAMEIMGIKFIDTTHGWDFIDE